MAESHLKQTETDHVVVLQGQANPYYSLAAVAAWKGWLHGNAALSLSTLNTTQNKEQSEAVLTHPADLHTSIPAGTAQSVWVLVMTETGF